MSLDESRLAEIRRMADERGDGWVTVRASEMRALTAASAAQRAIGEAAEKWVDAHDAECAVLEGDLEDKAWVEAISGAHLRRQEAEEGLRDAVLTRRAGAQGDGGATADHAFYLWDDTDEVTRDLCGVGCGLPRSQHPATSEPGVGGTGECDAATG